MNLKRYLTQTNMIVLVALVVTYLLFFITLLLTIRYSALNILLYSVFFAFIFILILLFGVVILEGIIEKKKKLINFGVIVLAFLSLVLIVTNIYVYRVNSSINNVLVNPNASTQLLSSFVVYDNEKITSVDDMSGLKLGVLSNAEELDRNSHVKNEIQKLSINISYVEYLSYNELLLGLFSNEVDVAVLPTDYYNQFSDYEGYSDYLEKTKVIYDFKTTVDSSKEIVDIDVTKEPFSLLIMGNDGGRTDSLILATYNPLKLSVTMTSIPRDSYVPIACYPDKQKDKIGHAFSVSRECALDTVEDLFNIEVNYFVEVNFKGVVEIVDALDKVWITSPVEFVGQNSDEERGHYTVKVFKGGQFATGEQALAFARERYAMPGGDYQRQENQQQVIQAIIDRVLQLKDINKALDVLNAAGNNVKTNMSLDQMIAIFNSLINAINKTNLESGNMLDIIGSRVMGYSSYTYNESLQLPLWISKPYTGSLDDLRALMLSNLEVPSQPTKVSTQFDARLIFYAEDYFAKVYNEKEVHETLPDFMPTMANNNWVLSEAVTWANKRSIKLIVDTVNPGDSLYNENVVHNYIISQSKKYGIKTSSFDTLTIKVIKHNLDCSKEENMQYDECKYKLPDWQDYGSNLSTISSAKAWFKNLGLSINIKYVIIPETDLTYDKSKIGYIIKQDPIIWDDVRGLNEITFTVMDPNFSILIPETSSWTITTANEWVKNNLEFETNIDISYEATTDPTLFGKLVSTTPTKGLKIKYQDILKVKFYVEGFRLKDYFGLQKSIVQTDCDLELFKCVYVEVSTTDSSKVDTIKSQSIDADTLKTKAVWAEEVIEFEVYKAAIVTP